MTPSDEASAAAWIAERLHPFGRDAGSVVPAGFDAYARHGERRGATDVLAGHTTTPDRCWFCLWDGYGYLTGATAVMTFHRVEPGRPPPPRPLAGHPPKPQLRASRVRLPHRSYLLFTGSVSEGEGWQDGPNLWWPDDRAWCVASEIDLDYTLVGGSQRLCEELIEHLGYEPAAVGDPL